MAKGNYNLNWETFPDHLAQTVALLRGTSNFSDVTVLCDDLKEVKAHRFILTSCSNVFRKIFENNNNPCIHLKGVKHEVMNALLDFMYNGQTIVEEENLSELLSVAKDLDVKELNEDEKGENEDNHCDTKMQAKTKLDSTIEQLDIDHVTNTVIPFGNKKECPLCFRAFTESYSLKKHIDSIHEGKSHDCNECNKVFTDKGNLSRHKNAYHKGIKYPCTSCAFVGSYRGSLKQHITSKHAFTSAY